VTVFILTKVKLLFGTKGAFFFFAFIKDMVVRSGMLMEMRLGICLGLGIDNHLLIYLINELYLSSLFVRQRH
jgi:hypothetical protein